MNDAIAPMREHYGDPDLMGRLEAALEALAGDGGRLTPERLAPLDQFHTRGLAATADLARLAGVTAETSVLDIGSGLGGPARFLANTFGCKVEGVDLSGPFVEAARRLTERMGLAERVSFRQASALDLPFEDGAFDVALLQHVAMNIADRPRLYGEIRRVLKPGGRFATFDIVLAVGQPNYPTPWARTAEESFLLTAGETQDAVERAGFRALVSLDDTPAARGWISELRASGPPPAPNLGVVMGPGFPEMAANLGRGLMEGRVGVLTAVFEAA
jgi:SAM-dependent methyltransferase